MVLPAWGRWPLLPARWIKRPTPFGLPICTQCSTGLKSTPKSIIAEVAIKVLIFKLNAANVIPLIAPPVPIIPATNPDKTPPKTEFFLVGFITNVLNFKKVKLVIIKKTFIL